MKFLEAFLKNRMEKKVIHVRRSQDLENALQLSVEIEKQIQHFGNFRTAKDTSKLAYHLAQRSVRGKNILEVLRAQCYELARLLDTELKEPEADQ